jgi:hypothetical protein
MDLNINRKHMMGVFASLILVILLSQSRFFNFLSEMALGRIVLLAFVIFISYTHQMLGLLAVLFVIIAFNHNDMNIIQSYSNAMFEGFGNTDMSNNSTDMSNNSTDMSNNSTDMSNNSTDMSNNATGTAGTPTLNNAQKLKIASTIYNNLQSNSTGSEGFCMSDKETNMLRGKQSNTVQLFNTSREQTDDVSPTDKSVFSSEYSTF